MSLKIQQGGTLLRPPNLPRGSLRLDLAGEGQPKRRMQRNTRLAQIKILFGEHGRLSIYTKSFPADRAAALRNKRSKANGARRVGQAESLEAEGSGASVL